MILFVHLIAVCWLLLTVKRQGFIAIMLFCVLQNVSVMYSVKVYPSSGAVEGGTRVTLTGSNLGYSANHTTVKIAGVTCTPVPEEYVVSTRYDHSGFKAY